MLFATALLAQAAKHKSIIPPAEVAGAFAKHFHGNTATWEMEDGQYEASFTKDGHGMSAMFQKDGTLVESEMDIKKEEMPASIMEYMKIHYKNMTIRETAKITRANGEIIYEAEVKGKDILFDEAGKFIKEVKD